MSDLAALEQKLAASGQTHLLRFWKELSQTQRERLSSQLAEIDFEELKKLHRIAANDQTPWAELAARAKSPPAVTLADLQNPERRAQAKAAGEDALRRGEVGFILVAGGQGTRLGFNQPKGMYPIGPLSERTLFQMMTDLVKARGQNYGKNIPVYLMTSPATDFETRRHAAEQKNFGLAFNDFRIFCQGTMPAVDATTGRCLLKAKDELFLSPDGHGGLLKAFTHSGCLSDAANRGIKYLFYCQIDNPLAQICDPLLIGLHLVEQSQVTSQVIRKHDPLQRVGNVVELDGRVQIIEYSDLPEANARETTPEGNLKFWAGSIAVHVFDVAFLQDVAERMDADTDLLPFHIAHKKVPHIDENGRVVEPSEANAFKFEKFVFDLLPLAQRSIVVEVAAEDGFAAVKNAPPATFETAATTKAAILAQHRRWLQAAGVEVSEEASVEIHPSVAHDEDAVRNRLRGHAAILEDVYLK